uniref:KRAB domain-containing protein n=1 Tax=Catharus ustulatus TaxID=91951 RepID=A0A8C3TX29_CATUS
GEVPVAFNDASFNFSEEEWKSLNEWQKELYRHIMKGNYEAVISMGNDGPGFALNAAISKPELLTRIEQGEDPNTEDQEDSEGGETPMDPSTGEPRGSWDSGGGGAFLDCAFPEFQEVALSHDLYHGRSFSLRHWASPGGKKAFSLFLWFFGLYPNPQVLKDVSCFRNPLSSSGYLSIAKLCV